MDEVREARLKILRQWLNWQRVHAVLGRPTNDYENARRIMDQLEEVEIVEQEEWLRLEKEREFAN